MTTPLHPTCGLRRYCDIVRMLQEPCKYRNDLRGFGPMSAAEIAEKLGYKPGSKHPAVYDSLAWLHRCGVLRIAGWRREPKRLAVRLYGPGPGPDEPYPRKEKWHNHSGKSPEKIRLTRRPVPADMLAFSILYKALAESPHSRYELVDLSGLNNWTASRVLAHMKRIDLVYVASWHKTLYHGIPYKMWRLGVHRSSAKRPVLDIEAKKERDRARQRDRLLVRGRPHMADETARVAANSSIFRLAASAA